MKRIIYGSIFIIALATWGCQDKSSHETGGMETDMGMADSYEGVVVSTTDAGGYTYVELEKDGKKFWAAGPATEVKVGDKVSLPGGSMMQNFQSKTLNRTFESILFAGAIIVEGSAAPTGAQDQGGMSAPQTKDMEAPKKGDIAKAGYTVEEIFSKKGALGSKTVDIRGKVVKASQNILGTNWYHIQDGTGAEGTNDLIVTSADNAEVGNTVVAKGTLNLDKDFGSGYKFAVIVEEAKLVVE